MGTSSGDATAVVEGSTPDTATIGEDGDNDSDSSSAFSESCTSSSNTSSADEGGDSSSATGDEEVARTLTGKGGRRRAVMFSHREESYAIPSREEEHTSDANSVRPTDLSASSLFGPLLGGPASPGSMVSKPGRVNMAAAL